METQGGSDAALLSYEEAARVARRHGGKGVLRRVLGDWANMLAKTGSLEEATNLYREALGQTKNAREDKQSGAETTRATRAVLLTIRGTPPLSNLVRQGHLLPAQRETPCPR